MIFQKRVEVQWCSQLASLCGEDLQMTRGFERRLQPRIEIKWPVTVLTMQTTIEGEIQNLSPTGKVVWSTTLLADETNASLGVGVQFTNITPGDLKFLTQLVKTYNNKERASRKVPEE